MNKALFYFPSEWKPSLMDWLFFSWKRFSSYLEWKKTPGRWSCNWHHDQRSDEGQDKDSTGLCLFDSHDPVSLCWRASILLDVTLLCESMLAVGIR